METTLYTLQRVTFHLAVVDDSGTDAFCYVQRLLVYDVGLTYKTEEAAKAAAKRIADDLIGDFNVEAFTNVFEGYTIVHEDSIKQFSFIMAEEP